ncbi:MAG: hypothetical protein AVDCRST_MAG26-4686, partial [uncultured Chloroflexia bacterium]
DLRMGAARRRRHEPAVCATAL